MKTKRLAKQETFKALNRMKKGERFQSDELDDRIERRTGEHHQTGTYLRYLRAYRQITGRKIMNVDKLKSVYEVIG